MKFAADAAVSLEGCDKGEEDLDSYLDGHTLSCSLELMSDLEGGCVGACGIVANDTLQYVTVSGFHLGISCLGVGGGEVDDDADICDCVICITCV